MSYGFPNQTGRLRPWRPNMSHRGGMKIQEMGKYLWIKELTSLFCLVRRNLPSRRRRTRLQQNKLINLTKRVREWKSKRTRLMKREKMKLALALRIADIHIHGLISVSLGIRVSFRIPRSIDT